MLPAVRKRKATATASFILPCYATDLFLSSSLPSSHCILAIVSLYCGGGTATPSFTPPFFQDISHLSSVLKTAFFNKVGMSTDLSALFSFLRAAGELMCASQIFMEDHESPLGSQFLQEEVRRSPQMSYLGKKKNVCVRFSSV